MPNNLAASMVLHMINHAENQSSATHNEGALVRNIVNENSGHPNPPKGNVTTGEMIRRMIESAERNR